MNYKKEELKAGMEIIFMAEDGFLFEGEIEQTGRILFALEGESNLGVAAGGGAFVERRLVVERNKVIAVFDPEGEEIAFRWYKGTCRRVV